MPIDPKHPDLIASLHLDPHAPRAARHWVRRVDSPSPDLRDAVALLTSELVTRAVRPEEVADEEMQLQVWMPSDIVRVELSVPRERFFAPEEERSEDLGAMVLDRIADRWSDPAGRPLGLAVVRDRPPPQRRSPVAGLKKERPRRGALIPNLVC